jgi:hypothetical protein
MTLLGASQLSRLCNILSFGTSGMSSSRVHRLPHSAPLSLPRPLQLQLLQLLHLLLLLRVIEIMTQSAVVDMLPCPMQRLPVPAEPLLIILLTLPPSILHLRAAAVAVVTTVSTLALLSTMRVARAATRMQTCTHRRVITSPAGEAVSRSENKPRLLTKPRGSKHLPDITTTSEGGESDEQTEQTMALVLQYQTGRATVVQLRLHLVYSQRNATAASLLTFVDRSRHVYTMNLT